MKTLCLTILSLFCLMEAEAQSPGNPTQINNTRYYSFKQFLGSDSAFLMPQRDTNWTPSRPAMIFRPGDSTVYYWNLRYWTAFAKAVSPTNLGIYLLKANFIDSLNSNRQQLSKVGDTVYLSFGGKVNVMPDTTTKVATIHFVTSQGYLKTETDPVFSGSPAFGITTININNWNSAFNNATFDSVSKKLRLFAINGAQDSLVINSVLATNFNPVSHDSTIIMQGTGKVYGDTLRVMVDTTRSGIATHNWTLGQGFIKSETDPVATAKTITMVNGSGVTIFGSPTQTLGSNPTWTFKTDTGLVATLAALGDSVVNKKHWDSAFVKVRFDTSSRVLTMYDFKNDSAFVVIPKGGTQNGMVAINTIRYGDILKIYADNGASTEITINNQDSLTRAHFGDTTTYFYPLKSNPAKYIPLTALSALVPLSYVNTTGVFSLDTSGAANGVATINYVNRQGYVKTETDPVATAKTVTVTQGTGITVTGASQTVGNNPAFTVAAQNTTAIWNANQLQGTPVSTTPPSSNQLLQYNGTNWIGFTPTYAPGFTVTVPITYSSNVIGLDTSSAAHGMASINYVQRQGYLTANQSITVTASGDATGSGSGNTSVTLPLTLANTGVTAGGFTRGVVNAKGLITSATDTAYSPAYVDTVATISQLELYNKTALVNTLVVTDSLRGGIFNKFSSGFVPDSGTVFPANGGGYWVRNYNKGRLNILWWGAKGDSITNNNNSFQNCFNSIPKGGGTVYIPKGVYLISDSINIPKTVTIIGDGGINPDNNVNTNYKFGNTLIVETSNFKDAFVVNAPGVQFERVSIYCNSVSTPTYGSAIYFKNGDNFQINYCSFTGFYININTLNAAGWSMTNPIFSDPVKYNLFIQDSLVPDAGGHDIIGGNFQSGKYPGVVHIYEQSGGGLMLISSNFNLSNYTTYKAVGCVQLNIISPTVDLQISNNVIENFSGFAIKVQNVGSASFSNININNNQISSFDTSSKHCIDIEADTLFKINFVNIIGNMFASTTGNSLATIFLKNLNQGIVAGNSFANVGPNDSLVNCQSFAFNVSGGIYNEGNINSTGNITDGGLLSAPFVATNSSGTFIPAAYTPYNPASYPVNAGGETLQSSTTRGNSTSNELQITGSNGGALSGQGLELQFISGSHSDILSYDRTANKYMPFDIRAGTTPTNFNQLYIDNTGFSFKDKNGITQASIDSMGDAIFNGNESLKGDSLTIWPKSYSWGATAPNNQIRFNSSQKITNSVETAMPVGGVDDYTNIGSLEFDNPNSIIATGNNNTFGGERGNLFLNSSGTGTWIYNDQVGGFSGLIGTAAAFGNANYGIVGVIGAQAPFTFTSGGYTTFTGHIDTAAQVILYKQHPSLNIDSKIGSPYGILQMSNYPNSFNGGQQYPIRIVTANTTVTTADYTIIDQSTGAVTINYTMPAASSCTGQVFHIVNQDTVGGGTITLSIGYKNYSGVNTTVIPITSAVTIQSDGTNYNQL